MSENINLQNEEENVIIATFNITPERATVTLKKLEGMTQIDWGDGIVNTELSHRYTDTGEYNCKIYGVTKIGIEAFANCQNLTSVVIGNGVERISQKAFNLCYNLTSVVISDSVTSIEDGAFFYCRDLTSVEIPGSVTSIGNNTFYYCSGLTSVTIGDGVTSIGSSAFSNCSGLTSIEIPDRVTNIYSSTFRSCSSLKSIVIGYGVKSISMVAFSNCINLTSVTFKSKNPISVSELADSEINNSTPTYYVPKESVEAYRSAWAGVVAEEKIQPNPDGFLINLEGLKIYHSTLKEKYLDFMATQDYVKEQLVGKTDYLGVVDTIPNLPNAEAGDYCRVQTEFVYDAATGEKAHVGDILIAIKDNPTQSIADWDLLHNELTSATLVTVGGVAQTSWDADTKVGFTDYATTRKAGVVKINDAFGIRIDGNGALIVDTANDNEIASQRDVNSPLKPNQIPKVVKSGLVKHDSVTLTDEEKASACDWIGAVRTALYSKNAGTSGTDGEYHGRVYAVKYDGTEETVPMANQAKNYSICWRDADANIYVGDPTQQLHCINKRYAEANFVAKPTDTSGFNRVYGINNGSTTTAYYDIMMPAQFSSESDAKRRNGIAAYNGGRLGCAPPERDYEATNKKYVDDLIASLQAKITELETKLSTMTEEVTSTDINTVFEEEVTEEA